MREETIKLADARSCEDAIWNAGLCDPVTIEESIDRPGHLDVLTAGGERLGRLSSATWVAKALEEGLVVHHSSVNSLNYDVDPPSVRIRVAVGESTEEYATPSPPRIYSVGLVGESNYQSSIQTCQAGQHVRVVHEIGNPYDPLALVVITASGEVIGYIPRENWLRRAIHEEAKGCDAYIRSVEGDAGRIGVVIQVSLNPNGVETRPYTAPVSFPASTEAPPVQQVRIPIGSGRASAQQQKGWFARLFGN
jgi:hypothetical protein